MTENISIVIVSKNRQAMVKELVNSLKPLKLIDNKIEIIVVEETSNPQKIDEIRYYSIPPKNFGFGYARKIATKISKGEIIIFLDDDVKIDNIDIWYKELTNLMKNDTDAVGGMGAVFPQNLGIISFCLGVIGHPGGGFYLHNKSNGNNIPISQISTCNTIIRKSVIEDVGGFDPRNKFGSEDTDLSIRITQKYGKNKFKYLPKALVWHNSKNKYFDLIKWYIRRGKADADLLLKGIVDLNYLALTSIMLKLLLAILLSYVFSWIILPLAFFIWFFLQMFRAKFMWKYFYLYNFSFIKKLITFLVFPFIKLTADIMFDFGRILRLFNKQNSKI